MVGMFPRADSLMGCTQLNQHINQLIHLANSIRQKLIKSKENYLMISPGVGQDEKTWLTEWGLQLVGEGTRGVPASNGMGASVLCKLEDSPLTIRPSRLHNDVLRVLNRNNHSGSQLKLLPGFAKVNNEDACEKIYNRCLLSCWSPQSIGTGESIASKEKSRWRRTPLYLPAFFNNKRNHHKKQTSSMFPHSYVAALQRKLEQRHRSVVLISKQNRCSRLAA